MFMADQAGQPVSGTGLIIPADIQEKFGELIELIKGSESMNDEERQYWINLLPVMTDEQVGNLKGILENEKAQLKAIDEKYGKEIENIGSQQSIAKLDAERKKKKEKRLSAEESARQEELAAAENLLDQHL